MCFNKYIQLFFNFRPADASFLDKFENKFLKFAISQ